MDVYIVFRSGMEWGDIISVHSKKSSAKKICDDFNSVPENERKDTFDRLSSYEVVKAKVED